MLTDVIDWLEVWACLVPLAFWFYRRPASFMFPVAAYFIVALLLNILADAIWKREQLGIPKIWDNNNPIYNLHSLIRFGFMAALFYKLSEGLPKTIVLFTVLAFYGFSIFDFWQLENFFARRIANILHSVESSLLIVLCLLFYLHGRKEETDQTWSQPTFWIVTGLFIFVSASFPVYLFYERLIAGDEVFTFNIWKVQKFSFLIFCCFCAKAFSLRTPKRILNT